MPRLDDVIADILPEAQNAPADVLKKAMLDAARTLCRRSKVWRVDVEGTLIPGIAQVELELPRETSVVDVAYLYTQRERGSGQAAHAALNACRKSPIYPLKNSFL